MLRLNPAQFDRIDARYRAANARRLQYTSPEALAAQKSLDQKHRTKEIAKVLKTNGGWVSENLPEQVIEAGLHRSLQNPSMWQNDDIAAQGMVGFMGLADMVAQNGPWPETPGLEEAMTAHAGGPAPKSDNEFIQQVLDQGLHIEVGNFPLNGGVSGVDDLLDDVFGDAANGLVDMSPHGGLDRIIPSEILNFPENFEKVTDRMAKLVDMDELSDILKVAPSEALNALKLFDGALSTPLASNALEVLGLGKEFDEVKKALSEGQQVIDGVQSLLASQDPMSILLNPLSDGILSMLGNNEALQKLNEIRQHVAKVMKVLDALGALGAVFPSSGAESPSVISCSTKLPTPVSSARTAPLESTREPAGEESGSDEDLAIKTGSGQDSSLPSLDGEETSNSQVPDLTETRNDSGSEKNEIGEANPSITGLLNEDQKENNDVDVGDVGIGLSPELDEYLATDNIEKPQLVDQAQKYFERLGLSSAEAAIWVAASTVAIAEPTPLGEVGVAVSFGARIAIRRTLQTLGIGAAAGTVQAGSQAIQNSQMAKMDYKVERKTDEKNTDSETEKDTGPIDGVKSKNQGAGEMAGGATGNEDNETTSSLGDLEFPPSSIPKK